MKKSSKIIIIIGCVLFGIILAASIYLQTAKVFGVKGDEEILDKDYSSRADNYYNGRFHNEVELTNSEINEKDPNKGITTGKGTEPEEKLPIAKPSYGGCPKDDVQITWYGHSTLLIRMHGINILTDPVFSDYMGLNETASIPRFESIHSYAKDLPHIDLCVLSHDHFDHLDYESVTELDSKIDAYLAPLGADQRLIRFGVSPDKVTNIAWWEEQNFDGLNIACTPAQHSSGRVLLDKRDTLWCSYVFYDKNHKIFFTGDTGFGPHFKEIHKAYGDMDFVLTDGAQFGEEKDKHTNHMFPEESAKAVSIMGAKKAMLIHWGSFCLSDWHAWDDPPYRFDIACKERNIDDITPMIGQTFLLSNTKNLHDHWWKNLK